ncbi:MAG TPA: L,D-transpeptidase [Bacteroidales bacterium]|nr:L,D-transpeptidase [Bacteroidales bacterium]
MKYKKRTWLTVILFAFALSLFSAWWVIRQMEQLQETAIGLLHSKNYDRLAARLEQTSPEEYLAKLDKSIQESQKKINTFLPKLPYLTINSTINQFKLFDKDGRLVREGLVSTGSYTVLRGNNRQWMFKTPRGQLKVLGKTKDPVWVRPDWAFIEEGLKVPPARHPSRFEYGTLGDYSLNLGDGYMIHGTLYKRFLGLPVTHGCVRMGDEDLEVTFKTLLLGSRVYIY